MTESTGIRIGNKTGQYFVQSKLDACYQLAERLQSIGCTDLLVWYDDTADFHHCDGKYKRVMFDIQYYIVYSMRMNGHDCSASPHRSDWIDESVFDRFLVKKEGSHWGQPIDVNPEQQGRSERQKEQSCQTCE